MMDQNPQSPQTKREGDPLEGLWHWSDHPAARIGIALAIMAACLVLFPLLAQFTF